MVAEETGTTCKHNNDSNNIAIQDCKVVVVPVKGLGVLKSLKPQNLYQRLESSTLELKLCRLGCEPSQRTEIPTRTQN